MKRQQKMANKFQAAISINKNKKKQEIIRKGKTKVF